MSNESNRDAGRSITPGDLQACDFFPPGHGWNKQEEAQPQERKPRECLDDETAVDGGRPH